VPDENNLITMRIFFVDESVPDIVVPLVSDGRFIVPADRGPFTAEVPVQMPNGHSVTVYAEVHDWETAPDVSIQVDVDEDEYCSMRCTSGAILNYLTRSGCEIFVQVGSGPWDHADSEYKQVD